MQEFATPPSLRNGIFDLLSSVKMASDANVKLLDFTIELFNDNGLFSDYYGYHNIDHELEVTYVTLLSGINNNLAKIIAFSICGLCCSIAGLIQSARLGQIDPHMGIGWELTVIAIAVLGGASLYGGKGSIEGTIIATLIIGVINNLLNLLGMSNHSQEVVIALIIIVMVLLHNLKNKKIN